MSKRLNLFGKELGELLKFLNISINEQKIGIYKKEYINDLINFIKDEAMSCSFNKDKLINKFNKCGIYLAIEDDLNTSKIRGGFKVHNNKPAIYITTKHKRIADIYFALLHEIAHLKSDYNRAKKGSIISSFDDNDLLDFELKADKTALNYMVDDKLYKEIIKSKSYERKDVVMPFLVYRLAHDKIISYSSSLYQKYNRVIED